MMRSWGAVLVVRPHLRRTESQPGIASHFTDVHYKGDPGLLRTVVARINQLKPPDFACFTGDLIEHARDLPAAVEMLRN